MRVDALHTAPKRVARYTFEMSPRGALSFPVHSRSGPRAAGVSASFTLALLASFALALLSSGAHGDGDVPSSEAALLAAASPGGHRLPAGRYGLFFDVVSIARPPVLPEVVATTTLSALVEMGQPAPGVRAGMAATQTACALVTRAADGSFTTTATEALVKAIDVVRYDVLLTANDGGVRFFADLGDSSLGYDLKRSPERIPQSREDPALTDPDGDGVLGAAMRLAVPSLGSFDLSIASRGHTVLRGKLTATGRAVGRPHVVKSDQRVIAGLPVEPVGDKVIDERRGRFVMQRLADDATCADVFRLRQATIGGTEASR